MTFAQKNEFMRIFLSLGSNLGDKQKNIETAYQKIEERIGTIVSASVFYVSKPVDFQSDNFFINSVCEVYSLLDIDAVFAITQEIEKEIGRDKKSINGIHTDRIIDIDILLADDLVIKTPELTIPHPRMHLRTFVLEPMREIAADVVHPVLEKTIKELLEDASFFTGGTNEIP
jgi:2-amino-4-hydroxy-6-hydroxymethyldihydropteridine diphosphokinase